MDIKVNYSEKSATIQVNGKLDATNSHKLKEVFNKIDHPQHPEVILDFTDLEMIDSSGIGKILVFYKKVKENNGNLIIRNPNSYICEIFDLIQLNKIIEIQNNL